MGKYAAALADSTTATSVDGVIAFTTATGDRFEIVECIMTGSGSTAAADTQHRATLDFSDGTTEAVGTAHTPTPFDPLSGASGISSVEVTPTTEQATIIAPPVVQFGFNQRGGMRWAVPRGEGVHVSFDHANEDISFRCISSAAGKVDSQVHWWEP